MTGTKDNTASGLFRMPSNFGGLMYTGRIQITLLVTDVARSVEFYKEVLGFGFSGFWDGQKREIVEFWTEELSPEYAEVFAGENAVGLRKAGRVITAGMTECSLEVQTVDRIYQSALRMGIDIPEPEDQPWKARTLSVRDPDGYLWHFIERREETTTNEDRRTATESPSAARNDGGGG